MCLVKDWYHPQFLPLCSSSLVSDAGVPPASNQRWGFYGWKLHQRDLIGCTIFLLGCKVHGLCNSSYWKSVSSNTNDASSNTQYPTYLFSWDPNSVSCFVADIKPSFLCMIWNSNFPTISPITTLSPCAAAQLRLSIQMSMCHQKGLGSQNLRVGEEWTVLS